MRRKAHILILCKTYPSLSAAYMETSCVAGMDANGSLIRLYPVPFRLVTEDQQFSKWQWIEASIEKNSGDHRPESHKIGVDTIQRQEVLPTSKDWGLRREMLDKLPIYESFEALDQARLDSNVTLGLIRPGRITALNIRKAPSESWTDEELEKLEKLQRQVALDLIVGTVVLAVNHLLESTEAGLAEDIAEVILRGLGVEVSEAKAIVALPPPLQLPHDSLLMSANIRLSLRIT